MALYNRLTKDIKDEADRQLRQLKAERKSQAGSMFELGKSAEDLDEEEDQAAKLVVTEQSDGNKLVTDDGLMETDRKEKDPLDEDTLMEDSEDEGNLDHYFVDTTVK